MPQRLKTLLPAGRLLLLGTALLILAVLPTELIARGPTLCLFKNVFGVECLGCGMTRAIASLLHADAAAALAYNKLVVVVFPLLCALLLKDLTSILQPVATALGAVFKDRSSYD